MTPLSVAAGKRMMGPSRFEQALTRCDEQPGRVVPVVDPNLCENKGPCVDVCPYDVFEIRPLLPVEWKQLGLMSRLKVRVHGGKQAFVIRPEACHACGLCVAACPEKAIKLRRTG